MGEGSGNHQALHKCKEGLNYYHLSPKEYLVLTDTLVAEDNNND